MSGRPADAGTGRAGSARLPAGARNRPAARQPADSTPARRGNARRQARARSSRRAAAVWCPAPPPVRIGAAGRAYARPATPIRTGGGAGHHTAAARRDERARACRRAFPRRAGVESAGWRAAGRFRAPAGSRAEPALPVPASAGRPDMPGPQGHRRRTHRDAAGPGRGRAGHPRAEELISGLTTSSAEFTQLWGRHDVEETTRGRMRIKHPLVGELSLDWDAYPMPGAPGPVLIVFTAPQGGPDAERLQRLADLLDEPSPAR